MDEGCGQLIGILILAAVAIYVLFWVATFLVVLLAIAAGIGIVYGGGLALRAPLIYFGHLFARTRPSAPTP